MLFVIFFIILTAVLGVLLWPLRQQRIIITIIGAVFFVGAFSLYAFLGSPRILPLVAAHAEKMDAARISLIENSDIVMREPKNLGAWITLGQSFSDTGQYAAAANAFKQAVLLSKGNPKLILAYAKAIIMADEGKVSDLAKKSLEMVLLQDPENPEAQYFLTVRKLQDGNTKEAMQEMKSLYRSLPDGSPVKEMIDRQIGR